MDTFASILDELGNALGIPLRPDRLNSCKIVFPDGMEAQLEVARDDQRLLIATTIGVVSPGRFREDFLEQALKYNGNPKKRVGIFGFQKKTNELFFYTYLRIQGTRGQQIADQLNPLVNEARIWKEALKQNLIPEIETKGPATGPKGMFGLVS